MKKEVTTLKVNLKEGNFVSASGEVNSFSQEKIVGNGWLLRKKDEIIEALCYQDYPDGTHSIRAVIDKDKRLLVTLRTPKAEGNDYKTETKKSSILAVKELTGTLCLSSGGVDDRYVYFRDNCFNGFLKKHKLTKYEFCDPNKQYVLKNKDNCQSNLFTDGDVDELEKKDEDTVEVKNATWVIFYQLLKIDQKTEIVKKLFTNEYYKKLVLPKILFESSAEEYVKNLKKYFVSLDEAKFYLRKFDFLELSEYEDKNLKSDREEYYTKYELVDNTLYIKVHKNFYWYTQESLQESLQESGICPQSVKFEIKKNRFMTGSVVLEGNVGICYV